jgi:hypothetical protein
MVRRLKKLLARPTSGMGQTQQQLQYWNLIHLRLGHRRRHRKVLLQEINDVFVVP